MTTSLSLRTSDVDRARRMIGEQFYADFMDVRAGPEPFEARFDFVRCGSLTVGALSRGAEPVGEAAADLWSGDCGVPAVKIDRATLDGQLERLVGRPVRALAEAETAELPAQPLVAAPLQEALVNGLLLTAGHSHRDELARPGHPLRPALVKRALDSIHDRPEHPFTVAELAAEAHVGVRRLQDAFRHYVGSSPITAGGRALGERCAIGTTSALGGSSWCRPVVHGPSIRW